jgi:hypothetical protein
MIANDKLEVGVACLMYYRYAIVCSKGLRITKQDLRLLQLSVQSVDVSQPVISGSVCQLMLALFQFLLLVVSLFVSFSQERMLQRLTAEMPLAQRCQEKVTKLRKVLW